MEQKMLDCLILGDSIAVGTQMFKKECVLIAKGGINSWQFNQMYTNKEFNAESVIISLSTNDHKGVKTEKELIIMREKVHGKRVYWILPAVKPEMQEIVVKLAKKYGDVVLPITRLQADGIHPSWAGYKEIVEKTK
jgi:hypothetical protein